MGPWAFPVSMSLRGAYGAIDTKIDTEMLIGVGVAAIAVDSGETAHAKKPLQEEHNLLEEKQKQLKEEQKQLEEKQKQLEEKQKQAEEKYRSEIDSRDKEVYRQQWLFSQKAVETVQEDIASLSKRTSPIHDVDVSHASRYPCNQRDSMPCTIASPSR